MLNPKNTKENKNMTKDITSQKSTNITLPEQLNQILDNIPSIFSRVETALKQPLKVIDEQKLQKIGSRIKEQNEKIYNFGRQDSQTTRKLMTLQMLNTADSTYRILRQILAQIERKQQAISENYVKSKKEHIELLELKQQFEAEEDPIEKEKLAVDIQQKIVNLSNSFAYLEGALKEVGFLQDCYEQIKKNKNIPDDWDEVDFEEAEIEAHIRSAFRNGIRDFLCHGRLGMGTCEYLEQFGISPIEATFHIRNYIEECNKKLQEVAQARDYSKLPDYNNFHDFLDEMAKLYKNAYKKACKRIGLDDEIISKDFILMSARNMKKYNMLPDNTEGEDNG